VPHRKKRCGAAFSGEDHTLFGFSFSRWPWPKDFSPDGIEEMRRDKMIPRHRRRPMGLRRFPASVFFPEQSPSFSASARSFCRLWMSLFRIATSQESRGDQDRGSAPPFEQPFLEQVFSVQSQAGLKFVRGSINRIFFSILAPARSEDVGTFARCSFFSKSPRSSSPFCDKPALVGPNDKPAARLVQFAKQCPS